MLLFFPPPLHCLPADGTVPFLSGERIAFSYLTSQKFTGDVASLDVLRDGKPLNLQIKVCVCVVVGGVGWGGGGRRGWAWGGGGGMGGWGRG